MKYDILSFMCLLFHVTHAWMLLAVYVFVMVGYANTLLVCVLSLLFCLLSLSPHMLGYLYCNIGLHCDHYILHVILIVAYACHLLDVVFFCATLDFFPSLWDNVFVICCRVQC